MVFPVRRHSCAYMSGSVGYRLESYDILYKNIAIIIAPITLQRTMIITISISITITMFIIKRITIRLILYGAMQKVSFF